MLIADLSDHPNRPLTQLRRVPPRRTPDMTPTFPRSGVSGHAGAVQAEKLEEPEEKGRLPAQVSRLAAWLEQEFGIAGKTLFFGDLVQVRRFQRDDDLASKVFARVREGLKHKPRVLIGHSLGSIVAYEALCRIPDHGITTLITLGSPLGLRSIREALRPESTKYFSALPPGVVRWVNVYDKGDPVSLAGGLVAYWLVKDETVNNGDQPHAITRYLGKKEVGQAVTDALT